MKETTILNPLTPSRLNRGQLIQDFPARPLATDYYSKDYNEKNPILSIHDNVQVNDVICVDWFETTLNISFNDFDIGKPEIRLSDDVYLINKNQRTQFYNALWSVVFDGEIVGTLQTHPAQVFMNKNNAQFKIENSFLYTFDWLDMYFGLLSSANWQHKNITRLDIAIDGSSILNALDLIDKNDKTDTIGRKGKASFIYKKSSDKKIVNFHVGSASSEKAATIYKKSDEIEKSGKTYIKDFWFKNNLTDISNVNRFELRLKSKIANRYDINRLNEPGYLASIVRTEVKNWFEFYSKSKDTNKHRAYKNNKQMNWIEWDKIEGQLLPKHKATGADTIHKAKRVIKDLYYFHHVSGNTLPADLIDRLLNEYCLHHWLTLRVDHWLEDFEKIKRTKGFTSN